MRPVRLTAVAAITIAVLGGGSGLRAGGGQAADWTGHGFDLSNRAYNFREQIVKASTVPRLKTKWTFPVNEMVATTPAVVDGVVYFGSWEGVFYAVEAETGRKLWTFDARALAGDESAWNKRGIGIRSGITVNAGRVYFGDTAGYLIACDAKSGRLIWRRRLENHPHVRIFSAAKIFEGRIYIGVSSLEESAIRIDPAYNGYTFRGSVVCLNLETGAEIWRFYTIPAGGPIGTKEGGRPVFGPAGASVWATPTVDPQRRLLYIATGNAYSGPKALLTRAEAVIALELDSGKVRWKSQARPGADDLYTNERLGGEDEGPDLDFGQSPMLLGGPHGNEWLACGQKSGWMYLLNPVNGAKIWQAKVGAGGGLGGLEFGSATDGDRIFGAIAAGKGNVAAIDAKSGKILWQTWNETGVNHAPVIIAGPKDDLIVFEGSNRGVLRAYDGKSGRIVWSFQFTKGTSIQGGATVANGMVFVGAGYHSALGGAQKGAGNELRAFSLDGR